MYKMDKVRYTHVYVRVFVLKTVPQVLIFLKKLELIKYTEYPLG